MATKVKHTSETLLNKKFSPAEKGYDPLEVDEVFDGIIDDYKIFEKELADANSKCVKQEKDIEDLKKELRKIEVEIAEVKKQYGSFPKNGGVSQDNVKLLHKIDIYERALYKKGVDPKKLLSDPDNC